MTALHAMDLDGRHVTVPLAAIRAMLPDEDYPDTTLLFLEDGIVKVSQPYDDLADQLAEIRLS